MPTRLIDLAVYGAESWDVRLVDVHENVEYAALNYCWGPDQHKAYATTLGTIRSRKSRIIHSDLPNTLQQAIAIARILGFRYL